MTEVGCALLPKCVAARSAAKPESTSMSLVNLSNHLGAIEVCLECKKDKTLGIKMFQTVNNFESWRSGPIVANALDNLLN